MDNVDTFEKPDRPNGRFFYNQSRHFYKNHIELLPKGYGIIVQEAEPLKIHDRKGTFDNFVEITESEPSDPQASFETVKFDARNHEFSYGWQYTYTSAISGRQLYHLEVSETEASGWGATYETSGQLKQQSELTDNEIASTWQRIDQLINLPSTKNQINQLRVIRQKTLYEYEWFKVHRTYTVEQPAELFGQKPNVIARYTRPKKVMNGILVEEIDEKMVLLRYQLRDDTSETRVSKFGENPNKTSFKNFLSKRQKRITKLGFGLIEMANRPEKP